MFDLPNASERQSRSRRWRVRISVRGLMVLILALGSWFGWVANRARVQREAVAAIERAGGHVYYEWQCRDDLLSK